MTHQDRTELQAVANVLDVFSEATVIDAPSMGAHAVEFASRGWEVGPLCQRERDGDNRITGRILSPHGKDPVGRLIPHGVLDFTSDIATVIRWWSQGDWNIGVRPPETMFVLDVDNMDVLAQLESEHGTLPETLTTISGRAAGGRHYWFWHPGGPIRSKVIKGAIETKCHSGYLVMPPSVHPDSGNRYQRIDAPLVEAPRWLIDLIRPPAPAPRPAPRAAALLSASHGWGRSPADDFNASHTWEEILTPHGWIEVKPGKWAHPAATAAWSATVKYDLLFIYTTSTEFDTTDASGTTKGYSKFRAYALLNFPGGTETERMSAATKSLIRSF